MSGNLGGAIAEAGRSVEARKPRKGSLAFCGIGCLGLITEDGLQEVTYRDGNEGMAYIGIHLTDKAAPAGSAWSSRKPKVVGHTDDFHQEGG